MTELPTGRRPGRHERRSGKVESGKGLRSCGLRSTRASWPSRVSFNTLLRARRAQSGVLVAEVEHILMVIHILRKTNWELVTNHPASPWTLSPHFYILSHFRVTAPLVSALAAPAPSRYPGRS